MGDFNSIFYANYASSKILPRGDFISMLIKELHGGVCRCNYKYLVAHCIYCKHYASVETLTRCIFI
jgi:hypothetical protein